MSDDFEDYNIVEHPMEEIFDIEPGTTMVPAPQRMPTQLADHEEFDEKDQEIEEYTSMEKELMIEIKLL